MAKPIEGLLTLSCLQCDWFAETTISNSLKVTTAFVEEAQAHANQHEQHAVEIVQRIRLYSENYVEPTPAPRQGRTAAARRDTGMQTGFLDQTRRLNH